MPASVGLSHDIDPFDGPIPAGPLMLVFIPAATAQAILDGDRSMVTAANGWPHENTLAGLWMVAHQGTHSWFATLDGVVIGEGGTFGPPDENGTITIGYGFASLWDSYAPDFAAGLSAALATLPGVERVVDGMTDDDTGSVDQGPPSTDGTELETLLAFIDYLRTCLLAKVSGLSDENARRPMVDSGTNLLGLLNHVAAMQVFWLHQVFAGQSEPMMSGDKLVSTDTVASVSELYAEVARASDEIVRGCGDPAALAVAAEFREAPTSLRWILIHLVEEIGRHAGHADILREQLDGSVGR